MEAKLFNKNFVLIIIASTLVFMANNMIATVSPQHCINIGGTKATAGFLMSIHTIAACITRPLWGNISDKKGRKLTIYIGALFCIISAFFMLSIDKLPTMYVARGVFGIGFAAVTTGCATVAADVLPKSRFSEGIAMYGAGAIFTQAISPGLAIYLFSKGFSLVMIFVIIQSITCVITIIFIKYNEKELLAKNSSDDKSKNGGIFEKSAIPASVSVWFMAFASASVFSFIPLVAEERGINGIGLFFTFNAIGLFFTRVIGASFPRKFGESRVFYIGMIIYFVSFFLISFMQSGWLVLTAGFAYGCGLGSTQPILNAIAVRGANTDRRGAATGTFQASQDIGTALGSAVWGIMANLSGFNIVFISSAFVVAFSAIIYKFMKK